MSSKATGVHSPEFQSQQPSGVNWLLVIAIDKYANRPLNNCVRDVKAFVEIVTQRYNIEQQHIIPLFNDAATADNIYQAFEDLLEKVQAHDNLIVYYSGHGDYHGRLKEGYWIPFDAETRAKHIANDALKRYLREIRTRHTLIICDSCFSGTFAVKGASDDYSPEALVQRYQDASRWVITSGSKQEVLDGASGGHSPFAEALLAKMRAHSGNLSARALGDAVISDLAEKKIYQKPLSEAFDKEDHQGGLFVFFQKQNEAQIWTIAQQENTIPAYEHFVRTHPNSDYQQAALAAIATLKAAQEWRTIEALPEEKENQVQEKFQAINRYLVNFPNAANFQDAEDLGEYLNYKYDFLRAANNLFSLRKFARQETPFRAAADKRISELEAALRQKEQEIENRRAAEARRKEQEQLTKDEAERKRQAEQQREKEEERKRTIALHEQPSELVSVSYWERRQIIRRRRLKKILSYSIGGLLLLIAIVVLINYFGDSGDTPPEQTDNNTTARQTVDFEPEMILVSGGTLSMGCLEKRDGTCQEDEKPVRIVSIKDFYIGKHEVTQAQWRAVMGSDPPELAFKGCDQCPVENVSWNDVQEFIKKLNEKTEKQYRLPSEAEWEYAARGGKQTKGFKYAGSDNLDEVGWFWENSGDKKLSGERKYEKITQNNCKTHPVGQKKANELGIHDMSGNVWEWCEDVWHDNYDGAPKDGSAWLIGGNQNLRVLRGGSWSFIDNNCRVAVRIRDIPLVRGGNLGFRLAQDK